jgi:hypothetical protein
METDEARESLRQAERAAAAPWIDYPPTPAWYLPAAGVFAAAMVVVNGALEGGTRAAGQAALVVVLLGYVTWYRRYRGLWPAGGAPRELRPAMWAFVAGALVVVLGAWALTAYVSVWVSAPATALVAAGLLWWYERAYADAARRARERLR